MFISDDLLMQFIRYFQDTYIGQRINGAIELPGLFPYRIWNMYHRVQQDLPRTNNSIEGWHNGFARFLPDHPSLPVLAAKYKKEQHKLAINREHHVQGRKLPRGRVKYRNLNERLKSLTKRLDDNILVGRHFLNSVAHLMTIA